MPTPTKNLAYTFSPTRAEQLGNDLYASIDYILSSGNPYWLNFQSPSKNLPQRLQKKLEPPKAARLILFAEEVRPHH